MSRAEVLQVLGALLGAAEEIPTETAFADDGDIPDWARTNIARIVSMGLISGFEDNTLRPGAVISRAEIAALLVRIHGILAAPAVEEPTPDDPAADTPVVDDPTAENPTTETPIPDTPTEETTEIPSDSVPDTPQDAPQDALTDAPAETPTETTTDAEASAETPT